MNDILPPDANEHWREAADDQLQSNSRADEESWNRVSYAYGQWIEPGQGDNFYVVTKDGIDVLHPYEEGVSRLPCMDVSLY